jgi:hypothetical protein
MELSSDKLKINIINILKSKLGSDNFSWTVDIEIYNQLLIIL